MAQRDIGNLRTRLSWEGDDANRSLEGFKRDLRGLRSEMNLARSSGREYSNSLKGMQQQSDILTRRFKTQEERVKELRKRYDELARSGKEDTVQAKELASQINNATAEMNRTEQQLKSLNEEIRRMESPWTKIGERMTDSGKKIQEFGREMTEFGRNYSMRVTAPIVAGGVAAFKASMDYESAFAGVRKTVDATEEEFQSLSRGIRDMAKELPASANEIASVAEAAGQLGIENDSILSFTRTIIDLGESTNLSLEQASSEFARFANIVGMSQDDFDRLGSSVVGLGNSMATTESEIMSLSMRLAAQGSQVGMTEAEIVALAGTMSSLGIEAEAGGTAMTMVLKKIDAAVGEGGKAISGFAKAANVSSKEFTNAWNNDPIKALDLFIKGLAESSSEGENLSSILSDLGIKGVRESDTILRMAGASDLLSEAVKTSSQAWKENTALTEEAEQRYATTESQLRMMWNLIKDVAITMGDALIPAVMGALDAAEPFIEKIEEGSQAFSEMDEEQQRTILKLIGLVAAVGPASVAMGGLTTTVGGFLTVGGKLATTLGKSSAAGKGTGLLGAIGMMGPGAATPVGLGIAGLGLLAGGVYYLNQNMNQLHDVSTEAADAMMDQYQSNNELITSFDELRNKSLLTNDEFARYLDLQSRLESETRPAAIELIKEAMEELQEKSGLSNKEFNDLIEYNNTITEVLPESTAQITDQGNRIADTTDKLRDYNQEIANMARRELEAELQKSLANELELREQIREAQVELNGLTDKETSLRDLLKAQQDGTIETFKEKLLLEQESVEEAYREAVARGEVSDELSNKRALIETLLAMADMDIDKVREALAGTMEQVDEQRKLVQEKEADLNKTGEIVAKMVEYELIAAGINEETARQVVQDAEVSGLLDDQLQSLKDQKAELDKQYPAAMQMTDEYKEAKREIDEHIGKLQRAKENIQDLIGEAGEYNTELAKDISKSVKVSSEPSIDRFNYLLSMPLTRRINIQHTGGLNYPTYAEGTNSHPGGPFIAGEEGWELGRLGNRWEVLNAGVYNRPRGYEVFPHDESMKILRAINNMPAYASGARPSGEVNRVVNQLNQQTQSSQPLVLEIHLTSEIDGRVAGKAIERYVTDIQDRKRKVVEDFA